MKKLTPEEILPDGDDFTDINGLKVRKGSIAAVLANIEILESHDSSKNEKQRAINIIKKLAPALNAIGLNKHVTWNNPEVRNILLSKNCI